VANINFVAG